MDLTDIHVTVNRLETSRLTSAVVQIRLYYVYTKQMYTILSMLYMHKATVESLNMCDLIEKYPFT